MRFCLCFYQRSSVLIFVFVLLVSFFNFLVLPSHAIGELDASFGVDGLVANDFEGRTECIRSIAIDSQGRIVAGGLTTDSINSNFALVRYTVSGDLDQEFGNDGFVSVDFDTSDLEECFALAVDNEDRVVMAGESGTDFSLVRITESGDLDQTFGNEGHVRTSLGGISRVQSVILDSQSRIIAGGYCFNDNNENFALARYNPDGSLDDTFGYSGYVFTDFAGLSDEIYSIVLDDHERILATGKVNYNHNNVIGLARYNSDGSLDETFGIEGLVSTDFPGTYAEGRGITVDANNRIILAGSAANIDSDPIWAAVLVCYDSNGNLYENFGNNGITMTNLDSESTLFSALDIDTEGRIIAGGNTIVPGYFILARYTALGDLDLNFGNHGLVSADFPGSETYCNSLAIDDKHRITLAGYIEDNTSRDFALARYITNIIDVTNTSDAGLGSLRNSLNISTDGDYINLNVEGMISLSPTLGELVIDNDLTIQGPGADLLSVSGNNQCRIFYINEGVSADISGISIVSGDASDLAGGGICNLSNNLKLFNCIFDGNSARVGGGLFNSVASPSINNCTFSNNHADVTGGGIYNHSSSSPTITNCTFYDNSASQGGGINNSCSSSPIITNCTFIENSANLGAGIYNFDYSHPVVTNSIFWNGPGEEINNDYSTCHPILSYCVVRNNLVGKETNITGPVIIEDPKVGNLQYNGGSTKTCELLWGSPATDAGTENGSPSTDQRGALRPWGAGYDIGSFERTLYYLEASWSNSGSITPDSADVNFGESVLFTVRPYEHCHIEQVYIDGQSIPFEPIDNIYTYTFNNVSGDHVISADFALDEYILSVDVTGSGTVEVSPDLSAYPHGTVVELTASPDISCLFSHWEDDLSGTVDHETIIMSVPRQVTAVFNTRTFTITQHSGRHGAISGPSTVTWGSIPTYTIICDTGYAISNVYLDGESQGPVSSLTLDPAISDHTISATFTISPNIVSGAGLLDFSITSPASLNGEILASLDLPVGITSEDLDLVSEDIVLSLDIEGINEGRGMGAFIESREEGETYIKGASFDIVYDSTGIEIGILPIRIELEVAKADIGEEYSSLIEEESADKGLRSAFLDHVGILKVISPDAYDLLEEAWEDYPEEEAKAFFEVSADSASYYIGINLLVADAAADNSEMTVQTISDSSDRYFFIFDGKEDDHFTDPIVIVRKPLEGNENGGGGGGGCSISSITMHGTMLLIPLLFLKIKLFQS